MAGDSNIEWTDRTWNPIVGCSIVSPGCTNCYAMKDAWRKHRMKSVPHYHGLTKKVNGNPVWTGKIAEAPEHILTAPLHWRKPQKIFVNSMGDLFHESIPDAVIDKVFAVMALCPQHTFQVLTKRAERMREYMCSPFRKRTIAAAVMGVSNTRAREGGHAARIKMIDFDRAFQDDKPFSNVWLGVSCERQEEADERIPLLLQTPAAVRFVSAEPLLGPLTISYLEWARLDWVIVGGESGRDARPMHPDWVRSIYDQCKAADVAFFFKQWGQFIPESCAARDHQGAHTSQTFGKSCVKQDGEIFWYVGKKAAGRLLDGKEHNEFPVIEGRESQPGLPSPDSKSEQEATA